MELTVSSAEVWTPVRLRKIYAGLETAPVKDIDGTLINRPITLPEMQEDRYTSTQTLLQKDKKEPMPNGVINPAFDGSMDPVNIDGNTSWSDTSSDNMKIGGDSRASTLTRNIEAAAIEEEQQSQTENKYNTYPPKYVQHKDPIIDRPEVKLPANNSKWDVFRVTSRDKDSGIDDDYISIFRKIVKVITSIFLSIFIILMTMLSKSTLLLITSNVYKNVTLDCETSRSKEGIAIVTKCRRVPPDLPQREKYQLSQNVEVRWLWALFVVITTPYLFTFCKTLWRICFKKTRQPTLAVLGIVLVVETLHSIGICIFAFYVLPTIDSIRGLFLCFGVAVVPSLLKLFDCQGERGRKFYIVMADIVALIFQISVLTLWPVISILRGEKTAESWGILLSMILISLGWWENYVNKYTKLGKLGDKLKELKKNIRRMRTKIYAVVSAWKIILTLLLMTALMSTFKSSCLSVLFFHGNNNATDCPHMVYPLYVSNVQGASYYNDPFWTAILQIFACLLCYTLSKTACKIMLQVASFSLPLMLVAPIMAGVFMSDCESWKSGSQTNSIMPDYLQWTCDLHGISYDFLEKLISVYYLPVVIGWWLSFMWVTFHIWIPRVERLVQTERLFVQPLYCGVFLEQSLMLNRRRDDRDRDFRGSGKTKLKFMPDSPLAKTEAGYFDYNRPSVRKNPTPRIYVCATMWHETEREMKQILQSLFRLDNDQCARKNAQKFFDVVDPDYYEFEAHIFFDDAFEPHDDDEYEYHVNSFVKQFMRVLDTAASKVHNVNIKLPPPTKYPTPYGGRLEWTLPGNNKLSAHLKDKVKVRHKKRWSQVMYMLFLSCYEIVLSTWIQAVVGTSKFKTLCTYSKRKQTLADNTYILALDGDVDFKPSAVQLLVDRMKKNEKVGAACGRIHPIGTGPMIWYQKFEYAVSHWLQKSTEHMIGCVLCSPGCFSLFRASALMDDNVMRKYTSVSTEARHYVQFDQGEDRWLCTLLLQQGYRVEYSAAADALTYAPEGFDEFYNQRRRWSPSTMANILDLLGDWKNVMRLNENISGLYIAYQLLLFLSSMVTPATIFLLVVGALNSAFQIDLITSLCINLVPLLLFLISCFTVQSKWQLLFAGILSLIYALVMMVVVVGLGLEMKLEGICSPTTIFMIFIVGIFIISAILHPQEFYCLLHGALYFLLIPSMSMLLMIYSICNLHVVSWGTRENAIAAQPDKPKTKKQDSKIASILNKFADNKNEETSSYAFSFGNLFKCLCCPKEPVNTVESKFAQVLASIENLEQKIVKQQPNDVNKPEAEEMIRKASEKKEVEAGVRYNPIFQQKALPHEADTPYWIHDPDIGHGNIRYINKEEKHFWKELIRQYLYPLQSDAQQQKKMQTDLIQLRNKASLMFFMLNALFVIIIFSLQYSNAITGAGLTIPLPCKDTEGKYLKLEPISMFFMAVFGIALLIQFISMIFHRLGTFLHIMASTEVNCMRPNQNEVASMDITSKVQLVKEMQRFEDDEDARSISTIGSDGEEDSSVTMDDSPKVKRKKTIKKLLRNKRRDKPVSGNLGGKFLKNFLDLANDLEKEGSKKETSVKEETGRKRSRGSRKRSKKALKAIELLEQNKENKESILTKAEAIKDKWQKLAKSARPESSGSGDKWGSLLRSVIHGQSRTSLNTISEDDKRSSWFRSIGKKMKRTNSDFSLPDLGSWSNRNSYAEPILNIISDELEPVDMEVGATSKNIPASKPADTCTNETRAIIERKTEQKNENIYDTADFIPSEVNSDSESDSDISGMKSDSTSKSDSSQPQMSIQLQDIKLKSSETNDIGEQKGDTQL
ncbi:chitin synthase [Mytilus galloprovincialis]|uniref:chitin synthase n=1 Tax=Mytilus galloprovincialis TaxID=29158 RepID=A0A8B6EM35_MYTGA|nr:chitin synthase [Mytilus galloprovincialis]